MALADYLCRTAVCTNMDCQERDESIRMLLESLVEGEQMTAGLVPKVLDAILDRERLGSTAIGRGVAVPHARLPELERILIAFSYSEAGIEFNALDGQPVHEVFLVVAAREGADDYLDVMQHITRLVQNEDFRRFVAQAKSSQEVIDLIVEMDR